jgi:hypothetical protein
VTHTQAPSAPANSVSPFVFRRGLDKTGESSAERANLRQLLQLPYDATSRARIIRKARSISRENADPAPTRDNCAERGASLNKLYINQNIMSRSSSFSGLPIPAAGQPEMICSRATALRFGKLISAVAGAERADAIVILRRQRAEMMTHVGGGKVPTLALFETSTGFAQWGAIETISA